MLSEDCPIPHKKQKLINGGNNMVFKHYDEESDNSEPDEWNLSKNFDIHYKELMKDHLTEICHEYNNNDGNSTFQELWLLIEKLGSSVDSKTCKIYNSTEFLSRCDMHLKKIGYTSCKSRFENLQRLVDDIAAHFPQFEHQIREKIEKVRMKLDENLINMDIGKIIIDVEEDIVDLQTWIQETNRKLVIEIDLKTHQNCEDSIQTVLDDIKIHANISNSINKMFIELLKINCSNSETEHIGKIKDSFVLIEDEMLKLWIRAMELEQHIKTILPAMSNSNQQMRSNLLGSIMGDESGFETEFSPLYPGRKSYLNPNRQMMCYISSSGDCVSDGMNSTDMPADSESNCNCCQHQYQDHLTDSDLTTQDQYIPSISSNMPYIEVDNNLNSKSTTKDVTVRKVKRRRRKKLRDKSCFETNNYPKSNDNLSTTSAAEDSIGGKSVYCSLDRSTIGSSHNGASLKRRLKDKNKTDCSNSMRGDLDFTDSLLGQVYFDRPKLNYSEIATAADNLIRKNCLHALTSTETPKESEVDEAESGRTTEIDVQKQWDYYAAPMYSTSDGDSEMVDVKEIREWEHEFEDEIVNPEILTFEPIDISENSSKRHSLMMTSGYETSIDSDKSESARILINILQSSEDQYGQVNLMLHNKHWEQPGHNHRNLVSAAEQQMSTINSNVNMLTSMLSNGNSTPDQPTQLVYNKLNQLLNQWKSISISYLSLIDKLKLDHQQNILNSANKLISAGGKKLIAVGNCTNENQLELTINDLKTIKSDIDNLLTQMQTFLDNSEIKFVSVELQELNDKITSNIQNSLINLNIIKMSHDIIEKSKSHRKYFNENGSMIQSNQMNDIYEELINCLKQLAQHHNFLSDSTRRLVSIELALVKNLIEIVSSKNNNLLSRHKRIFSGIPIKLGLLVAAVLMGWYCRHLYWSSNDNEAVVDLFKDINSSCNRNEMQPPFWWRICHKSSVDRLNPH